MPTKSLKQFVAAHTQFEQCMKQMVGKKRAEIASGEVINDATFLSTLILKSTEAQHEKLSLGSSGGGLSEDEIYGNLFFYHIAGHETTAGVLGYAVYLLTAFPEWQHWVHEEVDAIYKPHIDVDKMDYKETSPKLKRCLAIMVCYHF
jgi:cytochrome P450